MASAFGTATSPHPTPGVMGFADDEVRSKGERGERVRGVRVRRDGKGKRREEERR